MYKQSNKRSPAYLLLALALPIFTMLLALLIPAGSSGQESDGVAGLFSYVSPVPGAELVSSETTIAIRPQPDQSAELLAGIAFEVRGRRSGLHSGRIIVADDQVTYIFKPNQPFAAGEIVEVTIVAGSADPVAERGSEINYSFTVAAGLSRSEQMVLPGLDELPSAEPVAARTSLTNVLTTTGTYITAPSDFPIFEISAADQGMGDGYIFIGYFDWTNAPSNVGSDYLLILDNNGQPIYYNRSYPRLDFKKQPNGQLTYYDPLPSQQKYQVMDDTYTIVDSWQAGNGYTTDVHDLQILDSGHALLMIYDRQPVDMSVIVPGGDPNAIVVGCIVQEIDPAGNVVFEWRSWDHFSILDSNQDLTAAVVDYVHCNSVDEDNDGHLLLSSRHLDEVTKINRQTGNIIWRLGGMQNQFSFTNDPGFLFQHDARRQPNDNLTIYDNRSSSYSRAVEYALDETNLVATNVWEYRNTPDTFAVAMGNVHRLPNWNSMIGWGTSNQPVLTEVMPDGTKVFELNAAQDYATYRAFRFPWTGHPTWPPLLVARQEGPVIRLYFSWNGATEVASYIIYGDPGSEPTTVLGVQPRDGFETVYEFIPSGNGIYSFKVMPLDRNGNTTMFSNTFWLIVGGTPNFMPLVFDP